MTREEFYNLKVGDILVYGNNELYKEFHILYSIELENYRTYLFCTKNDRDKVGQTFSKCQYYGDFVQSAFTKLKPAIDESN